VYIYIYIYFFFWFCKPNLFFKKIQNILWVASHLTEHWEHWGWPPPMLIEGGLATAKRR
jgi:hypothetical protein